MYETVELARSGVIHALWVSDAPDGDERHLAALRANSTVSYMSTHRCWTAWNDPIG
ncbi:hypothetical protein MAHJHV35_46810 [Mycobacterium avium subsp. hominissuis]